MAEKNKKKNSFKPLVLVGDSSEPGNLANPLYNENVLTVLGGVSLPPLLQNVEFEGKLTKQLLPGSVTQENAHQVLDKMPEPVPRIQKKGKEQETCDALQVLDNKSEPDSIFTKSAKVHSYAETMESSRDPGLGYRLSFEPTEDDAIQILPSEILDIGKAFGFALVGFFSPSHPGKVGLTRITDRWKVPVKVIPIMNGWTTFVFQSESDREKVLCEGPYVIFSRTLLLKFMPDWFKFRDNEINSVPIWVTFHNLPLECWSAKVLSRISSKVGLPLMTDKLTKSMKRIEFARVLIDVDLSKELVRHVNLIDTKGNLFTQSVCYEFKPDYCTSCHIIGPHAIGPMSWKCKRNTNVSSSTPSHEIVPETIKVVGPEINATEKGSGPHIMENIDASLHPSEVNKGAGKFSIPTTLGSDKRLLNKGPSLSSRAPQSTASRITCSADLADQDEASSTSSYESEESTASSHESVEEEFTRIIYRNRVTKPNHKGKSMPSFKMKDRPLQRRIKPTKIDASKKGATLSSKK